MPLSSSDRILMMMVTMMMVNLVPFCLKEKVKVKVKKVELMKVKVKKFC